VLFWLKDHAFGESNLFGFVLLGLALARYRPVPLLLCVAPLGLDAYAGDLRLLAFLAIAASLLSLLLLHRTSLLSLRTDDDPVLCLIIGIRVLIAIDNLVKHILLLIVSIQEVLLVANHEFL
jgi:hypothetical protein